MADLPMRSRRWLVLVLGIALLGGLLVAAFPLLRPANAVPEPEAIRTLQLVEHAAFGAVAGMPVGCFGTRPGSYDTRVVTEGASYTTYAYVHCSTTVRRQGGVLRVEVDESWDDQPPSLGWDPGSWVRRLTFRNPHHTWAYLVAANGTVTTLAESGDRTPQSVGG